MAVSESKTCHREYLGLNLNVQTVHKSLESQFFVVHNKIQRVKQQYISSAYFATFET